jgi:hypothetical protein
MTDNRYPLPADDEISLFDIWAILVRRRWAIAVVFLLVFAVTAGYALLKEPENRLTAIIAVGQVPNLLDNPVASLDPSEAVAPVETPGAVVARLNEVLIPQVWDEDAANASARAGLSAQVAVRGAGLISLSAEAPASQTAATQALMTRIADRAVSDYRDQWQIQARWLENRIDELGRRESAINSRAPAGNRAAMGEALGLEGDERSPAGGAMMRDLLTSAMAYRSEAYRWDLADELSSLRLADSQMTPPRIERAPAVSAEGVGSGPGLLIALGAILGLMLGVFAAFIREFLVNARAYREQSESDQT